jgi:serine/threonine protein kinase/predicted flap endonuclease-1-like 5' DNA nuclease
MIDEEIAASPPVNESEQRAIETLRAELKDAPEKFTLVTNVRLPNGRGDFYEYDAIVVGERMVFAIEVKGYAGRIVAQRDGWFLEGGSAFENPSNKISIKAKTLGSLLLGKYRNFRSRLWVQDFVYVNGPGAKLTDADYARRTTFDVIGTAFDSGKALGSALRESQRWCKTDAFTAEERKTIVDYLRGGSARRIETHIGKYLAVERLVATSERYERLLVRDRFRGGETEKFELHVYPLDGRRTTQREVDLLFTRQIEIVRALGDSGTVARYAGDDAGVWHDQEVRYIAYEWLGAIESLGDRIARTGAPGLVEALRLGIALAESIATLHEQGLVHGALDPSSAYIRPPREDGEVMPRVAIGRIELARPQDAGMSVSAVSTISGSASCYASPDVLANKRPAIDDDLFSFGAMLAHIVRGRPLFASSNEILRAIRLPRLIEDRSADPPELVSLLRSLLARSPLSRPRSMRDVVTRLRGILTPLEERRHDPMRIGEYRVVRELRTGATGRTVVAERPDLTGEVVLKIAPLGSEETLRHEVETLRRLQRDGVHTNLVVAHDATTLEREKVLVGTFGLIAGEDGERVRGKLTASQLHPLIDGLLKALAFVHGHGILHRDVKPANIMIGPTGKVTLLDFGLAAAPGDEHLVIGTAPYKAESLFERGAWSYCDDLFAALTTIWEIATARHPWNGDAPIGSPTLDAADLGALVDDTAKQRFTNTMRELLADAGDGPGITSIACERLLATLKTGDDRLELTLPVAIELPKRAAIDDAIEVQSLSVKARRVLDDLGVRTYRDVVRLENAQFAGVRAFGRGVSDEIAALRLAVDARFEIAASETPSVLRSVQQAFAPDLARDAEAARDNLTVLGLGDALVEMLRRRGVVTVAHVAALDPEHLARDERIAPNAVPDIRSALHAYADDRAPLVVSAAMPPFAVTTRDEFIQAIVRIGGDPQKAVDLLEVAGGFQVESSQTLSLQKPLVVAPPWTYDGVTAALAAIEANAAWPPIDLTALSNGVVTPAALGADASSFFVERIAPSLVSIARTADGQYYRSGAPSAAQIFSYGAASMALPIPLAAFLSGVERRLPGVRLPDVATPAFEEALTDAGLTMLPNANVERLEAVRLAAPVTVSDLVGADVQPLSSAAQTLVAATRAGGYRLVVAEPAIYASRSRDLAAELRTALGSRIRIVNVDAELCSALRKAGTLEMAMRVQSARGPERDALEAIAGDAMRTILDGLLGGALDTLTIAINAGSLGISGVSNHLGRIYDAARGGRFGLVVVCVPGDHPSEHARLNRRIPLPIQPTEKPMALEAA